MTTTAHPTTDPTRVSAPVAFVDVVKRFPGMTALDGVSLELAPGEFVALLGPSGCGKTTALRVLAGLEIADEGHILIDEVDVVSTPPNKRDIGMVFQSYSLFPHLTVIENVEFGLRMRRVPAEDRRRRAAEALDLVGLDRHAQRYAHQLSGGQQQRVAIARVLAQDPTVILADEPVASLDPPTAHMVMRDLERINDELGITTIVNLHFLDLARRYADRIIGMREGTVVFDGPPAEADDAVFEQIYGRSLTADDVLSEEEQAEEDALQAQAAAELDAEESRKATPA